MNNRNLDIEMKNIEMENMHKKEFLLGPGDRVRFQDGAFTECTPEAQKIFKSLRGTITETDESGRECDYHAVK